MASVIRNSSSDQEQEEQDHQAGPGAECTPGDDCESGGVRLQQLEAPRKAADRKAEDNALKEVVTDVDADRQPQLTCA